MNFEKYTKLNKITKSIQLEMKPIGKTRETIERDNTIAEDQERMSAAKKIKLVADAFYREALEAFANTAEYNWEELGKIYQSMNISEYRNAAEKMKEQIANDLSKFIDAYIKQYIKSNGENDAGCSMSSTKFVDVLIPCFASNHEEFQTDEMEKAFSLTKGAAYAVFKKYFVSYEKIISSTGYGSIADRAIENFETVCLNSDNYKIAEKVEESFDEYWELSDISIMNKLLSQKGIDLYNELIGGSYDNAGNRIRDGFNIKANLYMQQNKDIHLYKMKKAKKQILTISEPAFKVEMIETKEDFNTALLETMRIEDECQKILRDTISNISSTYARTGIYISPASLKTLSAAYCEWNIFEQELKTKEISTALSEYFYKTGKVKKNVSKAEEKRAEKKVAETAYSLSDIEAVIGIKYRDKTLTEFLQEDIIKITTSVKGLCQEILGSGILKKTEKPSMEETRLIRKYLDAVMKEKEYARYFVLNRKQNGVDEFNDEFADNITVVVDKMNLVTGYYNKVRNYVTKKLNDKDTRTMLCFGRPSHFEQAWKNKQEGKFGNIDAALLEKEGKFYYIVPAAKNSAKLNFPILDNNSNMKSYYKYLYTSKGAKMSMIVPKLTFKSKAALEGYETHDPEETFSIPIGDSNVLVSKKFRDDYDEGRFRTDKNFLSEVIDFYRSIIDKHSAFSNINKSLLKPSSEYKNLGEFCSECDAMNYNVTAKYLDADIVDSAVEAGNLLMFLITNQDMYKDRKRMKNKYAILLNEIYRCMNENGKSIIINNSPKNFWRNALVKEEDKHPVGSILVNKITDDGKNIPDDVYLSLCDYFNKKKAESDLSSEDKLYLSHVVTKISDRPHIKDAHYTREMFYTQMPYTINKDVSKEVTQKELNLRVRDDIRKSGCNILSICRGTDNLLYYYMTDIKGNKLSAGPLNEVGGANYLEMLKMLGQIKKADQKDWVYDKKVSMLKDTYLGMITHVIADMAVQNNCIIVIDWISDRVKDKHTKFDASVYKKFENMLCQTLSCYVDKNKEGAEPGSIVNPLQLCMKDDSNHNSQNGIVFFTSSAYTKNICPSGFVSSLIDTYNKNTVMSKMEFLSRMNRIWYDVTEDCFKFEFTMQSLGTRLTTDEANAYDGIDYKWTVTTRNTRLRYVREKRNMEEYDGTETLKQLFRENRNVCEEIEVSSLQTKEVNALYETFILYANGYVPRFKIKESQYISPVIRWCNMGKYPYDEMTAKQLAEKGILIYNNVMQKMQDDATKADVEKIEWLNYLFEKGKTFLI